MTDEELQDLFAYWQRRLRLLDWHITLELVPALDLEDAHGDCNAFFASKSARIRLIRQSEWGSREVLKSPVDGIEQALVHELLHVHFAGFAPDNWNTLDGCLKHQVINILAAALIEEHRRHD